MDSRHTACWIVANEPPCLAVKEGMQYYAAVIGDGCLAAETVFGLITMGQFEKTALHVELVTAKDSYAGKEIKSRTLNRHMLPFLVAEVSIITAYGEDAIARYLEGRRGQVLFVYLCTEEKKKDEGLEAQLINLINKKAGTWKVRVVNASGNKEHQEGLLHGCDATVIEKLGEQIFLDYERNHPTGRRFVELSQFEKRANYNSAMHISTKLYLMGLRMEKEKEAIKEAALTQEEFCSCLQKERMEYLTRLEHLRWCAFYLISGYRPLPLVDADGQLHDREGLRHGCLVSWEGLKEVCDYYGKDFFKEDRDRVLNMLSYVKSTGHVVTRLMQEPLPASQARKEAVFCPRK